MDSNGGGVGRAPAFTIESQVSPRIGTNDQYYKSLTIVIYNSNDIAIICLVQVSTVVKLVAWTNAYGVLKIC